MSECQKGRDKRLRLVRGFPTVYCSPAEDIQREQAIAFPLALGGLGVGGGITSGEQDGIGRSGERPVASGNSPGLMVGLTPAIGLMELRSCSLVCVY